ncbi:MAG: zinc protease [Myxococcota bacterium]|jgi:zinc protease
MQSPGYTLLDTHPLGQQTIRKWRLDSNGLTLLTLEKSGAPIFAFHSWFGVGSRHERPGKSGIAHLFEHMMFKATENNAEGQFDEIMERRGAQTNAATWVDWTYYHEALPASGDNLQVSIDLEADRMVHLALTEDQLESEREVVMNERRYRVDDDPSGKMYEALWHLALGDEHPYGRPTIGWMRDIEGLSLADCHAFYDAYYAPNNVVLVAVGSIDTADVLHKVRDAYGAIPAGTRPADVPAQPVTIDSPRRVEMTLPISAPKLLMGYVGPHVHSDDLAALDVAIEVLFGGDSSRVHQRLVVREEIASAVDGWVSHFALPGLIEVAAAAHPDCTAEAVETALIDEIERLVENPPTERELRKARNQLEASEYRSSASADAVAGRLGHYEVTAGDFKAFFRALQAVRAVTAADVSAAAKRYLRTANRAVVIARPADTA